MSNDPIKRADQIEMLKAVAAKTDKGTPISIFAYPNCGWNLVESELVTQDVKITKSGRAALFLLGLGDDPTQGASFVETILPLPYAGKDD